MQIRIFFWVALWIHENRIHKKKPLQAYNYRSAKEALVGIQNIINWFTSSFISLAKCSDIVNALEFV